MNRTSTISIRESFLSLQEHKSNTGLFIEENLLTEANIIRIYWKEPELNAGEQHATAGKKKSLSLLEKLACIQHLSKYT